MEQVAAVLLVALVLALSASATTPSQGVDLSAMQDWDIVLAEGAPPSEEYAAEEFQSHFALATDVRLPIVRTTSRPDRHVFIGAGPAMKASAVGFDTSSFGPEDLRIVVRDDNIAIAGARRAARFTASTPSWRTTSACAS